MSSVSREWAKFAVGLKYEEIPEDVIKEVKRFLLDSVGCALAAFKNEDMDNAHKYIEQLGGREQATVIGYGTKTNLPNATLMNSLLIRALDYNDIFWKEDPSHPSDIIPAALSTGEYKKVSGKEALVAMVIAYELELRMCMAAHPGIREIGWHHASLTQFVSPVVAGRVLGLNEEQLTAAIGISGSSHFTLGGVVAGHLTNMKNTADPMAVEAGVRAAMLASTGYTGPVEVFEGKEGLFEVIKDVEWNKDVLLDGLGKKFITRECGYKAFPTEALTHQPITAVLELVHGESISYESVESILIETTTRGADILSDPSKYNPTTKETADHSLPYCIAVAVVKGNVLPEHFSEDVIFDPAVRDMLKRIKVVANPEIDALFPKVKRAIVTIKTKDGKEFKKQEDYAKGQPENPMSDEEVISKFESNAKGKISNDRIDEIVEKTLHFEEIGDVSEYMKLLY